MAAMLASIAPALLDAVELRILAALLTFVTLTETGQFQML
jgi:hypothetical protein